MTSITTTLEMTDGFDSWRVVISEHNVDVTCKPEAAENFRRICRILGSWVSINYTDEAAPALYTLRYTVFKDWETHRFDSIDELIDHYDHLILHGGNGIEAVVSGIKVLEHIAHGWGTPCAECDRVRNKYRDTMDGQKRLSPAVDDKANVPDKAAMLDKIVAAATDNNVDDNDVMNLIFDTAIELGVLKEGTASNAPPTSPSLSGIGDSVSCSDGLGQSTGNGNAVEKRTGRDGEPNDEDHSETEPDERGRKFHETVRFFDP